MSLPRLTPNAAPPSILYLIKQVELAIRSRLDGVVGQHGVTTLQYTALTVLDRHPGITAARLARNSFVRTQTMAQLVISIEQQGLIERERDPNMRRQVLLFLTPEGRQLLEELSEPVERIEREVLAVLAGAQAGALRASLGSIRHALSGSHPD